MAVTHEYQETIRKCNVSTRTGGGSDLGKEVVYVDWRPVLHPDDPNFPLQGNEYELGYDPRLEGADAWVDPELKWAPAPDWVASEDYISTLEKENAALKLELAANPK